jgi:hypothetical protein
MNNPFIARIGGVLSADIAVPDHAALLPFYARVLGTGDQPLWREDLINSHGLPIIGLGQRTEASEHLPLQWLPHFQVSDVATSVSEAEACGGEALIHSQDEAGNSQYAVIQDPNGAAFGVIPLIPEQYLPSDEMLAQGDDPLGHIAWLDLTVSDADNTRDFYRQVLGCTVQEVSMEDDGEVYVDYCLLADDGETTAGICHARGCNQELPPAWVMYLPVGNFQESLLRVQEEGGAVLKNVAGETDAYTYAVIEDPAGAVFAIAPA